MAPAQRRESSLKLAESIQSTEVLHTSLPLTDTTSFAAIVPRTLLLTSLF